VPLAVPLSVTVPPCARAQSPAPRVLSGSGCDPALVARSSQHAHEPAAGAARRGGHSVALSTQSAGAQSRSPHSSINLKEPCGAAAQAAEKLFPTVPPRCRLRIIPHNLKGELYLRCQWQSTLGLVRTHESEPSRAPLQVEGAACPWPRTVPVRVGEGPGRRRSSDVAHDSHGPRGLHPGACQWALSGRQAPASLGSLPAEQAQALGQGPRSQGRRPRAGATSQYQHYAASDVASEPRPPPVQRSPGRPSRRMGVTLVWKRRSASRPGSQGQPQPKCHLRQLLLPT
jgi:hypothetical protein